MKEELTDVSNILQTVLGNLGGIIQQLLGNVPVVGNLLGGNQLASSLQQIEGNLTDVITTVGSLLNGTTTLPVAVS